MTGYQSKKAAALDEDGMYLVHHTQPAQEPRTMKREALKLALEALETCCEDEWHSEDDFGLAQTYDENKVDQAIASIKEALAQPAQEPFGYLSIGGNPIFQKEKPEIGRWETLYTAQPQPAQEPASVTYKEVQDSMNALEKGTLYQQVIAEELGQRKLYTTPPQRTRVVLTDKEIEAIWKVALFADYGVGAELSNQPFVHYARAIEAKLRGKNNG